MYNCLCDILYNVLLFILNSIYYNNGRYFTCIFYIKRDKLVRIIIAFMCVTKKIRELRKTSLVVVHKIVSRLK